MVGLVGGLGPESAVGYDRRILEAWARERPGTAPAVTIDSLDVALALRLVDTDRAALVEYLLASLRRRAGAGGGRRGGGGTELPLLLPAPEIAGLPVLDATALHVAAIVERLRSAERDGAPADAP